MKPKGAKGLPILMILILIMILLLRPRLLCRIKSMIKIMSMSDTINRFAFHEANGAEVSCL